MIEAIELEKSFGAVQAVRGVSFNVSAGEAVGFLGPNGAGKTTTFRMLAGTIGPTSGCVRLGGKPLLEDPIGAKRLLGYMPENAPLYPELRGHEYLLYRAELKGIGSHDRAAAVEKAARQAEASHMLGTQIAHLSKGYRQRMSLADALLGDPPILLLDEPTSGLDPNQVLEIRRLIRALAKDRAIVLSTHILSEVAATCSRAIVIHEGRVVGQGTLDELQELRADKTARLVVRGNEASLRSLIAPLVSGDVTTINERAGVLTLGFHLPEPEALSQVIAACVESGAQVLEAAPHRAALDDVFAQLTSSEPTESHS